MTLSYGVMYNGKATESNQVTVQCLRHIKVMYSYMITSTVFPNIVTIHKRVEVEMADGSKPPQKFTDLCQKIMILSTEGTQPHIFMLLYQSPQGIRAGVP